MRVLIWALLVLTACAGPDADPVDVAERFHALRVDGNDRELHALLTDSDRAAVPLDLFPASLPSSLGLDLFSWSGAPLDSASLLIRGEDTAEDTAEVLLHVAGGARDTVRLVATHHPRDLWLVELDRVRWRVSMGLAEKALLDSLATAMRGAQGEDAAGGAAEAGAYLQAAGRYPDLARSDDVYTARSILKRSRVAESLRIDLRVAESFMGTAFIEGQVENTTQLPLATLRLVVRDETGRQERVELWDIPPGGTAPVRQLTRLGKGPVSHRLERIQVF